jgi:hypothetical protein
MLFAVDDLDISRRRFFPRWKRIWKVGLELRHVEDQVNTFKSFG